MFDDLTEELKYKDIPREEMMESLKTDVRKPQKKRFKVKNYASFFPTLKKWDFVQVATTYIKETEKVKVSFSPTLSRSRYTDTIDHVFSLFPEIGSVLDYTNSVKNGAGITIEFSLHCYQVIKLITYSQYLVPSSDEIPKLLTNVPQFPHLIKLLTINDSKLLPYAVDCFARVLRAWMAYGAKNIYYVDKVDYGSKVHYDDREYAFSMIPKLLDIFFKVFDEDVSQFLRFVDLDAVGSSILYNFLFVTELNMVHRSFLEELKTYMKPQDDSTEKAKLAARHISFLIFAEKLSLYPAEEGTEYVSLFHFENAIVFKMQFFAFIVDEAVDPRVALRLLCMITTQKMNPYRVMHMTAFAEKLKKDGPLLSRNKVARRSSQDPSAAMTHNKEYVRSIKTTSHAMMKEHAPEDRYIFYPLHLFMASLETRVYKPKMSLEALPILDIYQQPTSQFPFDTRAKVATLHDVFFLIQ